MRVKIAVALSLMALVLVAAACAGAEPTPTPTRTPTPRAEATPTPTATPRPTATPTPAGVQPQRGGTLRWGFKEPPHLDVHQSVVTDQEVLGGNAYNYLVKPDFETASMPVPGLGKSWKFSADGKTLTFELQSGVTWHDGQPFTCDDVKFTFERIISPPEGMVSPRKGQLQTIQSIACPNATTAVFSLERPWADALMNIGDPFNVIVAKHVAEPLDAAGNFLKTTVVGTGGFKFKRRIVGEVLELERNPNYWKPGMPYLDGIEVLATPEYITWVAGFKSGRFNRIYGLDSPKLTEELKADNTGEWTIEETPETIFINFIPDEHPGSPWVDLDVRKAAALAICQDDFIATMGDISFARWFGGPLPPGSAFALTEAEIRAVPGYGKDCAAETAQATQILAAKGLSGLKVEIRSRADSPHFRDSGIVMGDMLAKAGWEVTTFFMEQGPYYDMVNNKKIPLGQAVVHSIAIANTTPDAILGQAYHPDGARNYGDYEDDDLRQLFVQQSQELDTARRKALLKEYQIKVLEGYHSIIGAWRGTAYAWYSNIHGLGVTSSRYWPVAVDEVWIEQ